MEAFFSRNSVTLLFCYFCNNICSGFRIMTLQFQLLLWMKLEALFQWINCDVTLYCDSGLLIEPEIFSYYGGNFDTFWFLFYCDSEYVMNFEKVLGQFLVRLNDHLLQNISKWLFPYVMAASLFRFVMARFSKDIKG